MKIDEFALRRRQLCYISMLKCEDKEEEEIKWRKKKNCLKFQSVNMGRQKYLKQNVTKKSHMIKGRNNFFLKIKFVHPLRQKVSLFFFIEQ